MTRSYAQNNQHREARLQRTSIDHFDHVIPYNVSLPIFSVLSDDYDIFDWLKKIEILFGRDDYSERRKILLASWSFKGYANLWWETLTRKRRVDGKGEIRTWESMKYLIKKEFALRHYEQKYGSRQFSGSPNTLEPPPFLAHVRNEFVEKFFDEGKVKFEKIQQGLERLTKTLKEFTDEQLRKEAAALRISKNFRQYRARKSYLSLRSSAITLQTGLRAMMARKNFRFRKSTKAAIVIQAHLRHYMVYSYFKSLQTTVLYIQRRWRGRIARRELIMLKMVAWKTKAFKEAKQEDGKHIDQSRNFDRDFNVDDLMAYKCYFKPYVDPFLPPSIDPTNSVFLTCPITTREDKIEDILDEQIVLINEGEIQHFFVCWMGRPNSDCMWICKETLQHLDPDLLEHHDISLLNYGTILKIFDPGPRPHKFMDVDRRWCSLSLRFLHASQKMINISVSLLSSLFIISVWIILFWRGMEH